MVPKQLDGAPRSEGTADQSPPQWGINSVGRVPALQAGCQEFDSPMLHARNTFGAIAQLVARFVRIEEVRGSIPLSSTSLRRTT